MQACAIVRLSRESLQLNHYFFSYRVHRETDTQTARQTHTHTHTEYSIVAVDKTGNKSLPENHKVVTTKMQHFRRAY